MNYFDDLDNPNKRIDEPRRSPIMPRKDTPLISEETKEEVKEDVKDLAKGTGKLVYETGKFAVKGVGLVAKATVKLATFAVDFFSALLI